MNNDKTEIVLIFGNKTTDDFLLKEELEEIQKSEKINFKVIFTIDKEEENWKGEVGFIGKQMITKYCPKFDKSTLVMSCGPPAMNKSISSFLKDLDIDESNYLKF